jgi:AAA domain-containing protein
MSSDDGADEAIPECASDSQSGSPGASQPAASGRKPLPPIVALSQVAPEPLRWLSPGRLAAGKVTILDGDPGLGKSTLLCEIAARISRGDPLPGGEAARPRPVVLMSAEDNPYDTIRPRIDAAGGDPRRVIAFASLPDQDSTGLLGAIPDHVYILEEIITRTKAALLIIDPLVAFLARGHNANSYQGVRRAFHSLNGLAERTGVAIVAVRHLNKSATANPLYRGLGSIGIIAAARCGLLLAPDPNDAERRILASSKANLGRPSPALAFRLLASPGSHVARVVWDGESEWTADQLLRESASGVASHSLLTDAREWLRAALADGPRSARNILREAHEAGIGRNVLYAARKLEGVSISKERVAGGRWVWSYPTGDGEHPADSDTPEVR